MTTKKINTKARSSYEEQLVQAAIEIIRSMLRSGSVSLENGPNGRYRWGAYGIPLRLRDCAIKELVEAGEIKIEPDVRKRVLVARAVDQPLVTPTVKHPFVGGCDDADS